MQEQLLYVGDEKDSNKHVPYLDHRCKIFFIRYCFELVFCKVTLGLKPVVSSPGWVAPLVGASSHTPKSCGFDFWLGRMPRLWIQFPGRAHMGGNPLMSLTSSVFIV